MASMDVVSDIGEEEYVEEGLGKTGTLTMDELASLQKAGLQDEEPTGVEMVVIEANPKNGREPRKRCAWTRRL